jgi:hypothetical protein
MLQRFREQCGLSLAFHLDRALPTALGDGRLIISSS